jgi:hypothetical protein
LERNLLAQINDGKNKGCYSNDTLEVIFIRIAESVPLQIDPAMLSAVAAG